MGKRRILSALFLLTTAMASAQSDSLHIPFMEEVYRHNSWLAGENPVGLSFNRFRSFSVAEVGYSYHKGNLGNVRMPASTHTWSVYSESFQTIGKVSVYGKLEYANKQKQKISWNGMTGNYWQGLNLCDSVRGNQHAEQYQLKGAFSLPIHRHWLIGLRGDYIAELTAKDTDPRNKNQWLEWKLTPGVGYQSGQFNLGTSLSYASRKERVDYQNIGTHVTYPFLVSYPIGFYKTLPKDGNVNWHYSANEIGGAIQMEYKWRCSQLFHQIAGNSAGQTIISNRLEDRKEGESDHWNITYRGSFRHIARHHRHEWNWLAIFNGSNNYDPLQQQQASGMWESYGKIRRSTCRSDAYAISYGYYQLRDSWNPRLSWVTGMNYQQTQSALLFYPMEYSQDMHRFTIHTTLTKNFLLKSGTLDCTLGGEYGEGGGNKMKEKQLQDNQTTPDIKLWQNQDRLEQDFRSYTEARWSVYGSVSYTHRAPITWFIRLTGKYENANKQIPNGNKEIFSAQLGLLF